MANSSDSALGGDATNEQDATSEQLKATQAALLQSILDTEPSTPWIASETANEYAQQVDTAGESLEFSDQEIEQGWQGLSAQLNQLWGESARSAGESSVLSSLQAALQAKFAGRLPQNLLTMIGEKAQQVASSGQPMVKQLIACVQDGLDNMAEADLQVMARPMAFAMRGSSADEFVEATIKSIRQDEWEALSPIEQARLSLAAARYAISQTNR